MAKLYDVLHEVVQGQDTVLQNYINSAQNVLTSAISMDLVVSKAPDCSKIPDMLYDQSLKLEPKSVANLMNADQSLIFKKSLQALPIERASILPPRQKAEFGKCLLLMEVAKEYQAFEHLVIFRNIYSKLLILVVYTLYWLFWVPFVKRNIHKKHI